MALDTDLSGIPDIANYVASAPAYAMSGNGYAFLHSVDTRSTAPVLDPTVTVDPGPLYRFIAAMDWLEARRLTATVIHAHIGSLQSRFLSRLDVLRLPLSSHNLLPPLKTARGNFPVSPCPKPMSHSRRWRNTACWLTPTRNICALVLACITHTPISTLCSPCCAMLWADCHWIP